MYTTYMLILRYISLSLPLYLVESIKYTHVLLITFRSLFFHKKKEIWGDFVGRFIYELCSQ